MRRFLILGGFLALGTVLVVLSFALRSDRTRREDMTWVRGRTPAGDATQGFNHGRIGSQPSASSDPQIWIGTLVDAGCPDRTREALRTMPDMSMPEGGSASSGSADRVAGVDRSDAMEHQVPDLASRQTDAGCAVTGMTRAFALYLPNGELVNLDEGGNTKALALFQATPDGQNVLEGRARGAKPRVSVTGIARGDRIVVDSVAIGR